MPPLWIILLVLGSLAATGLALWTVRTRLRRARRRAVATDDWQARALLAEQRVVQAETVVRTGLLPHLARLLRGKLVVGLLSQRSRLLDTQQESTERVADLEQRLAAAHGRLENRLQEYERRLGEHQEQGQPAISPAPADPSPVAADPSPVAAEPPPPDAAPRRTSPFRSRPAVSHAEPVQFSHIVQRKIQTGSNRAFAPGDRPGESAPPSAKPPTDGASTPPER